MVLLIIKGANFNHLPVSATINKKDENLISPRLLPIKTGVQFWLELFIRGKYCKNELLLKRKNLQLVTFFVIHTLESRDKSGSRKLDTPLDTS